MSELFSMVLTCASNTCLVLGYVAYIIFTKKIILFQGGGEVSSHRLMKISRRYVEQSDIVRIQQREEGDSSQIGIE